MLFIQQCTDPNAIVDQQDEDDAFYAATLREMVAMGLEIGRVIHQKVLLQAKENPYAPIDDESSISYDRIFRAVRRGILLAKRLNKPEPTHQKPSPSGKGPDDRLPTRPRSPKDAENPQADLRDPRDRLDTPDPEEDLENRPIIEIINEIQKDLGLKPSPAYGRGVDEGHPQEQPNPRNQTTPSSPLPERERLAVGNQKPSPSGQELADGPPKRAAPATELKTPGPPYPPGS